MAFSTFKYCATITSFLPKHFTSEKETVTVTQYFYLLPVPGNLLSLWICLFWLAQAVKNLPAMWGHLSLTPGSGRSPGEGNGNPLQYFCLGNTTDRGAWHKELDMTERKGDDRGWDGWMVSLTQWTWVWVNSGNWWWTGSLACCSPWGCRVRHDWATELNWTEWLTRSS